MEIEICAGCKKTGEIICFCSNVIVCTQCVGRHLIDFPSLIHKPVLLKDFHMRSLVSSSWKLIQQKENEILAEAAHVAELEKTAKLRLEKELVFIDNFAQDSIGKVKNFCDSVKQEINAFFLEYQQKVQKACENYKNFLMNESNLLEAMKSYSKDTISELELSNFRFSMTTFSLHRLLSENISFDIGLQGGLFKTEASSSVALMNADASPTLESPYRQRSRTRVSTKIQKKVLPMSLYSPNEGKLMIYNIPSGEVTQIEGKIDSLSICTATADGSIIITGGLNPSTFIYNILEKTLEKTENMIISRFNHAGVFLGDFVYVIGGRNDSVLNNCERFDLIEKSWQKIGDLSTAREKHSACVYRGRIFVAGGDGVNTFEVFNTVSNKFSTLRTLLSIPGCSLMFPVEDFLVVFHGKVVSAFDPTKLTLRLCSSLDCEDWYTRCSVFVNSKEAYFVRDKTVYKYEVEGGGIHIVCHLDC